MLGHQDGTYDTDICLLDSLPTNVDTTVCDVYSESLPRFTAILKNDVLMPPHRKSELSTGDLVSTYTWFLHNRRDFLLRGPFYKNIGRADHYRPGLLCSPRGAGAFGPGRPLNSLVMLTPGTYSH